MIAKTQILILIVKKDEQTPRDVRAGTSPEA